MVSENKGAGPRSAGPPEKKVPKMIRMEIALFLVLTLVASVYFSAGKKPGNQHR